MTPGPATKGVFLRLYYPAALPLNETINQSALWPLWADDDYLFGFVRFMQAMLARWPSWAPRGEFLYIDQVTLLHLFCVGCADRSTPCLKVSYIAPLMHLGCTHVWRLLNGKVYCPILRNATISTERRWPVIVFSHGMGCSRFAYSRICTDLSSHGFVVAATEHRDASAAISFTMEAGKKVWIPHRRISEEEKEYSVRNQQLNHRVSEIMRTLDVLEALQRGDLVENVLEDGHHFEPGMFAGKLDVERPVLAGHSYGGATTLVSPHCTHSTALTDTINRQLWQGT